MNKKEGDWKQAMGPNAFRGLLSDSMEYPKDDILPSKNALGCLKCKTVTPLIPCSNCGHQGYHLNLDPDKMVGLFCTRCRQGFTTWKCSCDCINPISYETILSKKGGGCFVVTAAYGGIIAPEVVFLSTFRDQVLSKTIIGQQFIQIYYAISPYFAEIISKSETLRTIIRILLIKPLICLCKKFQRIKT